MIRTFRQHDVRKQQELSGRLWNFMPLSGKYQGRQYQVSVPGCWENLPEFEAYRGKAQYTATFTAGGNVRLEFKGVSHTAEVYVDGELVREHYNAYTAFDVILQLEQGEHLLEVKVDNRFSEESALHIPNDYMTYGGITRPVVLEELADTYIKWVHVTPVKEENWKAKIEVCVANLRKESPKDSVCEKDDSRTEVKVELAGQRYVWSGVSVPCGEEGVVSCELSFEDVEEWGMHEGKLYEVHAWILEDGKAVDDLIDRTGFRQVTVENGTIYINGSAPRIKGFCRHEDHPQFGCAIPYEAMVYDLMQMRDLGANSVRTVHYPNDEVFLDLCDEMGILVWEENHARGLSEERMKNPNFERQAEDVIREMIPLHYNHPSIYIWGILNECASNTEYGKECYQKQFDLIQQLDTSRPRSFASCQHKTDLCLGIPEVVSYNIYPLWYSDQQPEEFVSGLYDWVQETEGAGKPFLITEIGAGAVYGFRHPSHEKWTEEYQAETLKKQIDAVMQQPGCQGMYIWQYCDVRVSREWFNNRPRTMNNKGVVDEYRRPKLSYEVVRDAYASYTDYAEE